MTKTGSDNKGQADNCTAQQGPAGQTVAGRKKVFNNGKVGKRVGTKQAFIEIEISA